MGVDMRGLAYPKPEKKKRKKKKPGQQVIHQYPGTCYLCQMMDGDSRYKPTEVHHIFGGPNRSKSDQYGLVVRLCPYHHRTGGRDAVHTNAELADRLHRIGQIMYEQEHSREEFVQEFGKNYLG